jgi:hypothetical protein
MNDDFTKHLEFRYETLCAKQKEASDKFEAAVEACTAKGREFNSLQNQDHDWRAIAVELRPYHDAVHSAHAEKHDADRVLREYLMEMTNRLMRNLERQARQQEVEKSTNQAATARRLLADFPFKLRIAAQDFDHRAMTPWCYIHAGCDWMDLTFYTKRPFAIQEMIGFKSRKVAMHFKLTFSGSLVGKHKYRQADKACRQPSRA